MIKTSLSILFLITLTKVSYGDPVAIIRFMEINDNLVVQQITSSNWSHYNNTIMCVIDTNTKFPVNKPVLSEEMTCDGGAYKMKTWNLDADITPKNQYAILSQHSSCGSYFKHVVPKSFELVAGEVRYIDIENLQHKFSSEIFEKLLGGSLSEEKSVSIKEVKQGLSGATLRIKEYDYSPGNTKLHYSQLFIKKESDGVLIDIPVADFWVRLFPVNEPKVLQQRLFFDNYLKANSVEHNIIIENNLTGPYVNSSSFYFLKRIRGYESVRVELQKYYTHDTNAVLHMLPFFEDGC